MTDKLVEKLAKHLWEALQAINYPKWEVNSDAGLKGDYRDEASSILKLILSDPSIVEIEPDAELPNPKYNVMLDVIGNLFAYKKRFEKANWVKKKDGGRK